MLKFSCHLETNKNKYLRKVKEKETRQQPPPPKRLNNEHQGKKPKYLHKRAHGFL